MLKIAAANKALYRLAQLFASGRGLCISNGQGKPRVYARQKVGLVFDDDDARPALQLGDSGKLMIVAMFSQASPARKEQDRLPEFLGGQNSADTRMGDDELGLLDYFVEFMGRNTDDSPDIARNVAAFAGLRDDRNLQHRSKIIHSRDQAVKRQLHSNSHEYHKRFPA